MEILHRGSESVGVEAEMRNNISRFFVVCHENLIPRKDCPPPPPPPPGHQHFQIGCYISALSGHSPSLP